MSKNKLIIAAAGAGKTTYLVNMALDALAVFPDKRILITTYTRSNAEQIREKVKLLNQQRNGNFIIPEGLVILEWCTFLLREGVRPYKSAMHESLRFKSVTLYHDFYYNINTRKSESDVLNHYFLGNKIIQNSLSKFVVKANEKTTGLVIGRLTEIYSKVFIDEVQDLAGFDLEIIKELFKSSAEVLLVGDPRQVTYLTHYEKLNSKYRNGGIKDYVLEKCRGLDVEIDETTLKVSHRNAKEICVFSSNLYPGFEMSESCKCLQCRNEMQHLGVFIIRNEDVGRYLAEYPGCNFGVLRNQNSIFPERNYGESKGLTYDRVIIHPTDTIIKYLKTGNLTKVKRKKNGGTEIVQAFDIPKFYVAVTRARHSVAVAYDYSDGEQFISNIKPFRFE